MSTARFRPHAHALQGALSVGVLAEFLNLRDILSQVILQPESEDKPIWQLAASCNYTAKSAYEGFFKGAILFSSREPIWTRTWAPKKKILLFHVVGHAQ